MNDAKIKRIFVAGHNGMVGSAIVRALQTDKNYEVFTRTRKQLDLTDARAVNQYFQENSFDEIYLAAAKVGGIHANNTYPADFIYENLAIQNSIIHSAFKSGTNKLLFLGSSCIYPRDVEQPMRESALLSGYLEPTNEPYAIAKIAGIKMCESYNRQYGSDFRSVMPTNLYGPGDNYHPENSHVIPALIRRFHNAKLGNDKAVEIWGTGAAFREFLHVNDMVNACLHVMKMPKSKYGELTPAGISHINVGTGLDCSIREIAELLSDIIGFKGELSWDATKPDGTPRKLLDTSILNQSGWSPNIQLAEGLAQTYVHYLSEVEMDTARVR